MKKSKSVIFFGLIVTFGLIFSGIQTVEAKAIKPKIKNIYNSNGSLGKVYVVSFCGLKAAASKPVKVNVKAKIKGGAKKSIYGLEAFLGQSGCGAVDVNISGGKSFRMQALVNGKWSKWSNNKKYRK